MYQGQHAGSNQYYVRTHAHDPYDRSQWFKFDWRTKTIRSNANSNMVMSVQLGGNVESPGYYVMLRPYVHGDHLQLMRWHDRTRATIENLGGMCADWNSGDYVQWYKCNPTQARWQQGWKIDKDSVKYPKFPFDDNVHF